MPPELACITSLQNCGSHSKTGALQCVCVVLCKMSCMMRVLILIFSDRISCHCNANTLLRDECSFCAVCDSWCNLSVYSWAVMKCNFWNEWLSSGSPAQKGSSPHCGCPLTLVSSSPWQKKKKPTSFQPWQCCRACVGAGEQVMFDEAWSLSATLLGDDF